MSWSKSTSGTAASIIDAMNAWKGEVATADQAGGANQVLVDLHGAQVDQAVAAATAFGNAAKEGYNVSVSASGHAAVTVTDDESAPLVQSDQWSVNLSAYKPAAAPVAG